MSDDGEKVEVVAASSEPALHGRSLVKQLLSRSQSPWYEYIYICLMRRDMDDLRDFQAASLFSVDVGFLLDVAVSKRSSQG